MTTPPPDQGRNPYGPPPGSGGPGPNPGWRPPYPPPGQQGQYPPPGQQGQYPPPGQQGQYPPPGQQGQYPPPGHPGSGAGPWGGPTPPPKKDRTVLIVVASLVTVVLIGIVALVIVGSGSGDDTAATPSGTAATTPGADETPDGDGTPGADEAVPEDAGDVSVDVAVGDCIRLGGSDIAAEAEAQECGSPASNYQVIAKAATQEQCPSDIDAVYYETGRTSDDETGALCLDYDLVAGDCYDATTDDIVRVDCGEASDPAKLIIKFTETVQGTSDDSVCDGFGVAYDERNFVACFADVTPS